MSFDCLLPVESAFTTLVKVEVEIPESMWLAKNLVWPCST